LAAVSCHAHALTDARAHTYARITKRYNNTEPHNQTGLLFDFLKRCTAPGQLVGGAVGRVLVLHVSLAASRLSKLVCTLLALVPIGYTWLFAVPQRRGERGRPYLPQRRTNKNEPSAPPPLSGPAHISLVLPVVFIRRGHREVVPTPPPRLPPGLVHRHHRRVHREGGGLLAGAANGDHEWGPGGTFRARSRTVCQGIRGGVRVEA
jgi:hypothetical protein